VIVHNLHVFGTLRRPHEAHAKLIVDAYAVLPGAVAFQGFQLVARGRPKEVQCSSGIQLSQLAPRYRFNVHESFHPFPVEQGLRVGAFEGLNHCNTVYRSTICWKPLRLAPEMSNAHATHLPQTAANSLRSDIVTAKVTP
jgi:hypothetical protein